jgi:glycosyltransferase involved in cell wall biosynthesis
LKRIKKLGIAHRVEQKQVPIQELAHFYSNALALLYPTRYEGFGLPLLEAMASGIPIFASDTPVNREIGAEAGIYFTPGAHEQLSSYLIKRLNEPQSFRDKIEIGLDRAREFTWARCAQKTAIAYKELVEELKRKQK